MTEWHEPVMVDEVLESLLHRRDGEYVDGTVGTGGHSLAILEALAPEGRVLCVDQSDEALAAARERLHDWGERARFFRGSFSDLGTALTTFSIEHVDGILLDLGLNSWLLARGSSGLSYQIEAPLSMRLDRDLPETAESFLARASADEIVRVLREYGDVNRAPLFARRILEARSRSRIDTTGKLVSALRGGSNDLLSPGDLSRLFQALRVQVNREMERLEEFLEACPEWLRPGGRLVIISYASHEDRRVKRAFGPKGQDARLVPLLKHPRVASPEEVRRNVRARSAKLRVFEKGGP